MNATTAVLTGRRKLALSALAGVLLAVVLGVATDEARAAYTAKVQAGTLAIAGDSASDKLVLRLEPGSPNTLQVDVGADGTADFSFDRSTFTAIQVSAGRGDDEVRVDQSNGSFADEILTINGGAGADTLIGGSGAETLVGGSGDDVVVGRLGADRALMGDGNDRFEWNPGDSSDVVDGQRGIDLLDFDGASIGESIGVSPNGGRVRFARDVGNVVTDLDDVEQIRIFARGGADTVVVNNMTGTDLTTVDVDLDAAGVGGDAQPDTVVVYGTSANDRVEVGSAAGKLVVSGLSTEVRLAGAEAALDVVEVPTFGGADTISAGVGVSGPESINVDGGDGVDTMRYLGTELADAVGVAANGAEVSTTAAGTSRVDTAGVESLAVLGLGGADTITAAGDLASLTALTLDGGDGGDKLQGGNGADLLIGGPGNDTVGGDLGADRALLGDGDDRFEWNPGDSSDVVEGEGGHDLFEFSGSSAVETLGVSANGGRVRFTRDPGNVVSDLDDVEQIRISARGGADTVVVDDLTGTDARTADVYLSASWEGGGDSQADTVIARGADGPDVVTVRTAATDVVVSGLFATVRVQGAEAALDTLRIETLGGDDSATVAPDVIDWITLVIDLGADD
jgi:Ca2+-binding RTX toxin-like protein